MEGGEFRFGFAEDGDVGIGVFPEGEEIGVGGFCFGGVAGESVGAGQAEMSERAGWEI